MFQHTTDNKITMVVVPPGKVAGILSKTARTFVNQEVTALHMNFGIIVGSAGGTMMPPDIPDQHTVLEFLSL